MNKRRSGLKIMLKLSLLVKPLMHIMILAIVLGVLGYLCAISLTVIAVDIIAKGLESFLQGNAVGGLSIKGLMIFLIIFAIMRGVLHYLEQYCNHFIAFKLLAIIRNKVFTSLRRLCPAKLEVRDKGNLISIITTDIELLEVFYAHTISPIAIAILTSITMVLFISSFSFYAGALAFVAYCFIGILIPIYNGKKSGRAGMEYRNEFGELNSFILASLRGISETMQFSQGEKRKAELIENSQRLSRLQRELSQKAGVQRGLTNSAILFFSVAMLFLTLYLCSLNKISFSEFLICTASMLSSFGSVTALASLSNNLNQTFASGERVLSILEEKPMVEEVFDGEEVEEFKEIIAENISFAYENKAILKDFNVEIEKNKVTALLGSSGCGKSTFLKLLMRFWDIQGGKIKISDKDIKALNTKSLRELQGYVTQDTQLFHDSLASNIAIGKLDASREEIIKAAKKASIHDFIVGLPKGYDTEVGELGDTLSGGERQRIGLARAFLHNSDLLLLDEPTSNLDSLNEGIILKSIKEECKNKAVVLVSHRRSTLSFADIIYEMDK